MRNGSGTNNMGRVRDYSTMELHFNSACCNDSTPTLCIITLGEAAVSLLSRGFPIILNTEEQDLWS